MIEGERREELAAADELDRGAGERRARRWGWLGILAAGLLAYANTFNAPFVFDSKNYIEDNPTIRLLESLHPNSDGSPGTPPTAKQWDDLLRIAPTRMLGYVSFAVNYYFAENRPPSWHATNLAIHLIAGLALYGVVRRGLRAPRFQGRFDDSFERLALVAATLWVVHPLATQGVTYIYQRIESMTAMFCLLTMYAVGRYADGGRLGWAVAAVVACALGMTSKEIMIVTPFLALWYDAVFLSSTWDEPLRRRLGLHGALFATLAVLLYVMSLTWAQYKNAGILDQSRVTPMEYALTQPGVVLQYFKLVVWPMDQNIDYAWRAPVSWKTWQDPDWIDWKRVAPQLTAILGMLAATVVLLIRRPALGFLAGSVFFILAPTSSFAPIIDFAFEHRMYLPLAPALVLLTMCAYFAIDWIVGKLGGSAETVSTVGTAAAWLTIAALIALTLRRNYDYRSHQAIWHDAMLKAPDNERAAYNYGVFLQLDAKSPQDPLVDLAIAQYLQTLVMKPDYPDGHPHLNLASLYYWRLEYSKAIPHYLERLRWKHDDLTSLYALADCYERTNQLDSALAWAQTLLHYDPQHADGLKLKAKIEARRAEPSVSPTAPAPAPTTGAQT